MTPQSTDQYVYQVHGWRPEIIRHRLVKWTTCFVTYYYADWKQERRARHEGEFFQSWIEAHAALKARVELSLRTSQESVQRARSTLGQIESMKEPA